MESIDINNHTNNVNVEVDPHEIRLDLPTPLELQNKEIALGYLGIYYSWRNITASYNNNKLQYRWVDNVVYDVDFPDGFYSIDDLSTYLQKVLFDNNHYVLDSDGNPVFNIQFETNFTYYCTSFYMSPVVVPVGGSNPNNIDVNDLGKTPQLIIPYNNKIDVSLGVDIGEYPPTYGTSVPYAFKGQKVPKISPVETLNIACNVSQNRINRYKSIIYSFSPDQKYGSYISIQPTFPIFFDAINGSYTNITLTFVDQNYKPIPILDKSVNAKLFLRSKNNI